MRAVNVEASFQLARELARQAIAARQPGSFLILTALHASTQRNQPTTAQPEAERPTMVRYEQKPHDLINTSQIKQGHN